MPPRPDRLYALPDGATVPPVSTVLALRKGEDFRGGAVAAATERGTAFHALLAADLRGEGGDVPDDLAAPWRAWASWSFAHGIEPEAIEQPMAAGAPWGFGGTPDLIGLVDGVRTVVDFKLTTEIHYVHRWQVGAYAVLWNALHPDRPVARGLVLRFDPAGNGVEEGRLDGVKLAKASEAFVGLLTHWHAHEALKAIEAAERRARRAA